MTEKDSTDAYWPEVLELLERGESNDAIIAHLHKKGVSESITSRLIDLVRKERYALRRRKGVKLMLAGAVMLLLGFVITLAFVYNDKSIDFVMYGMTLGGIAVFLWGVVDVLGF
jgi:hypothetical protein